MFSVFWWIVSCDKEVIASFCFCLFFKKVIIINFLHYKQKHSGPPWPAGAARPWKPMPWRSQHRGAQKLLCASALLLCNLMHPDLLAEHVRTVDCGISRREELTCCSGGVQSSVRSSERPILSQTFAKTDCVARCLILCTCADGSKKHLPFSYTKPCVLDLNETVTSSRKRGC